MKIYTFDKREIRSFRMRYRSLEINHFLNDDNGCGLFVSCDTMHPSERIAMRPEIRQHNLKLTRITDKIGKILFNNKNNKSFQNILAGNVILITKKDNTIFDKATVAFISKNDKFSPRLFTWNKQLYRGRKVNILSTENVENKQKEVLSTLRNTADKFLFQLNHLSAHTN